MQASPEQLVKVEEVGDIVAASIHDFFATDENRQLIEELRARGLNLSEARPAAASRGPRPFEGKTFVVTGALKNYTREGIHDRIKQLGGRPTSSVSAKTDYVVVGKDAGSKQAKAEKLGVRTLTEEAFEALARGDHGG